MPVERDVPGRGGDIPAAGAQVDDGIDGKDVEGEARSKPPAVHDCRNRMQAVNKKSLVPKRQPNVTVQQTACPDVPSAGYLSWSVARTWDDVKPDTDDGQQQHDWRRDDVGDIALCGMTNMSASGRWLTHQSHSMLPQGEPDVSRRPCTFNMCGNSAESYSPTSHISTARAPTS